MERVHARGSTRRELLIAGAAGAAAAAAAGGLLGSAGGAVAATPPELALGGTDGYITLPGRARDLYIFGFVPFTAAESTQSVSYLIAKYKGQAQHPAPILGFRQESDARITLTNLGLVGRPDLTDSHTIHWHGFRTPVALMDGVPEVSISVPLQRQFTYFYRPHNPGTYMYHCHFEDVEHVQMGMTGIVFVRPTMGDRFAYNDASTAFDREFALLLNELWTLAHDNDETIQETIFTDYDPNYFTLNGRCYPQTILGAGDPSLPHQPISSLVQANEGERVLFRLANLGYRQHAMQLPGIAMKVIGEDATLLRSPAGVDTSYRTNTIYMGPGEARDVLFTAPSYSTDRPIATDAAGPHNTYVFKNRDAARLSNDGAPGPGGMMTEVRVYPGATLPPQSDPNETHV
jgi:FtsP/CotA-like multicopper oxidase with cupredoxin domain